VGVHSAASNAGAAVPACGRCRHFAGAPADLEHAFPGLVSFGSGYSSVRADDGLCRVHDRYVTASHHCGKFAAHA
jgi:hypothetical protein